MSKGKELSYKVKHSIKLELDYECGDLILIAIESSDPKENKKLDENGKYCCWDGLVTVAGKYWIIDGFDGPGGGYHIPVRLIIPKDKIVSMKIGNLD